jgi:lipopolysaccharide export system permease protein
MVYNILLKDISFSIRNPGPREMSSVDVYREIEEREAQLSARKEERAEEIADASFRIYQTYLSSLEPDAEPAVLRQELLAPIRDLQDQKHGRVFDRTLQIYWIEYFKKFSIPFACLVFVVFAFPVGLFTKRSGRAVGFGIGLLVSVLYWSMLIAGQTLGMQQPDISPFLSMWGPNFVVLVIGILVFALRFRR